MFILLDGLQDPQTVNNVVDYVLGIGITGAASLVFGLLWWRTNNKLNKVKEQEVLRLIEDKKSLEERFEKAAVAADSQTNILWTEINKNKSEEIEKYNILTQALNETQLQTVKALQGSTEVVKANTNVMDKNTDMMNRHMITYEKFIEILFKKIN